MSEIKQDLMNHNYLMGRQIEALIKALGMHWENLGYMHHVKYDEGDFARLYQSYSDALTHNGIFEKWQG